MVVLPDVQSQHLHGDSQQSLTPRPGDSKAFVCPFGDPAHKGCRQNIHSHKKRKVPDLSAILSRPSYPVLTTVTLVTGWGGSFLHL